MSDLLKSYRAMDDDRFAWRVRDAMLVTAMSKLTDSDPLALHVISNPQGHDTRMVAIVANDPNVRAGITVDEHSGVTTEAVTDEAIQNAVNESWDTICSLTPTPPQAVDNATS